MPKVFIIDPGRQCTHTMKLEIADSQKVAIEDIIIVDCANDIRNLVGEQKGHLVMKNHEMFGMLPTSISGEIKGYTTEVIAPKPGGGYKPKPWDRPFKYHK